MKLKNAVLVWAAARGLLNRQKHKNPLTQYVKAVEEIGELGKALINENVEGIKDGIGDVLVCLIVLARQQDMDIEECLEFAYEEIKDRRGKMLANGNFVKDEQAEPPVTEGACLKCLSSTPIYEIVEYDGLCEKCFPEA